MPATTDHDFAVEPKDHLTVLPPELLHTIFEYLFPAHVPDIAFLPYSVVARLRQQPHDLEHFAASCRQLHNEVNAWARHWLKSYASITRYKPSRDSKKDANRDMLCGRGGLLVWKAKHCNFCGRTSSRSAIFSNGFRCSIKCDLKHWSDKITKTNAKAEYGLSDKELLPHQHNHSAEKLLPRLTYGMYMTSSIQTTMFVREEVQRLAEVLEKSTAGSHRLHAGKKKRFDAEAQHEKQGR
ncbi:hypothetical protein LTR86_010802 [Recurvomyces mirabilis]|nr:hypothetical protein LTR86_010802 [Recurvomyces mirabilis]